MPTSFAAWANDRLDGSRCSSATILSGSGATIERSSCLVSDRYRALLEVVDPLDQVLDALVTQRPARPVAQHCAAGANVRQKHCQRACPEQSQDNDRNLKNQSDALQFRPFFFAHHLVQLDQDQQLAVLVAHALMNLADSSLPTFGAVSISD
jgi:hypothetical protein